MQVITIAINVYVHMLLIKILIHIHKSYPEIKKANTEFLESYI